MARIHSIHDLVRLFESLRGGVLVAFSGIRRDGAVRLIVENRGRLAVIPDSWGRLVVTLSGCRRCEFRDIDGTGTCPDWDRLISQVRPVLHRAHTDEGAFSLEYSMGLAYGALEVVAEDFSLMLGSGRTLGFEEFLKELKAHEEAPGFARAS